MRPFSLDGFCGALALQIRERTIRRKYGYWHSAMPYFELESNVQRFVEELIGKFLDPSPRSMPDSLATWHSPIGDILRANIEARHGVKDLLRISGFSLDALTKQKLEITADKHICESLRSWFRKFIQVRFSDDCEKCRNELRAGFSSFVNGNARIRDLKGFCQILEKSSERAEDWARDLGLRIPGLLFAEDECRTIIYELAVPFRRWPDFRQEVLLPISRRLDFMIAQSSSLQRLKSKSDTRYFALKEIDTLFKKEGLLTGNLCKLLLKFPTWAVRDLRLDLQANLLSDGSVKSLHEIDKRIVAQVYAEMRHFFDSLVFKAVDLDTGPTGGTRLG